MAILQISRLQARHGLQQDLPQLASAEFGWSLDERRLFIGNGTLLEGAPSEGVTEILTQYTDVINIVKNYIFKGYAGGYTAQTGASVSSPSVRLLQDKLDDFVNVKDFGAVGDGNINDLAAINRALEQIYLTSKVQTIPSVRRTIYFPAGTYKITGGTISIPAWVRIVGDGIDSSIIKQVDPLQPCVVKFVDSAFQTGTALGSNNAALAANVNIESIGFHNINDKNVLEIDSASDVTFKLVSLIGALNTPVEPTIAYAGVKFAAFKQASSNIKFEFCKFSNLSYALLSDVATNNVQINSSVITNVYKGIKLGENSASAATAPTNIRVTNSLFSNIGNRAIDCYANSSNFVSLGNQFINVGNNYLGAGNAVSEVIKFTSGSNYSIADYFDRTDADALLFKSVDFGDNKVINLHATGLTLGTATVGTGSSVTLLDAQLTAVTTGITVPNQCVVNFSLVRGTALQTGTIAITTDGTTTQFMENSTSTADSGVTFSVIGNTLFYKSTVSSNNATLRYNINYF